MNTTLNTRRTLWWGSVAPMSILELASAAAAGGFGSIAITPDMFLHCDDVAAVRDELDRLGVVAAFIDPCATALPGSPDPQTVPDRLKRLFTPGWEAAFDAAEAFGAGVCICGFLGQPLDREEVLPRLTELVSLAAARGIKPLIEFIPGTQIPDLPTAVWFVEQIGGDLKIVFDTWHFARLGGRTTDLEALPREVIGAVQISDRDPDTDESKPYVPMVGRLMPGEGGLPLHEWLSRIVERSPGAELGLELFSQEIWARPSEAVAREAFASLEAVFPS